MKKPTKDGYSNIIAGLGGANPKTAAGAHIYDLSTVDVDAIYRTSTWFGKIIDIPADDAVREWRTWNADAAQITALEATEKRLKLRQVVRNAMILSRLKGGAAIVIGGLPGDAEKPLILDQVKKDSVKFLTVLSRDSIASGPRERDPLKPGLGAPKYYTINNQRFHASRVVRVIGRDVNHGDAASFINDGWGDSVWQSLGAAIMSADMAGAVLDALLAESKVDVLRVGDFMENIATKAYQDAFIQRMTMAAVMKSITNAMVIDKSDEWEQKVMTWAGLPDVVMTVLTIMAGAADIPLTRLLGTSAKGLNATGDGDLKNYYDRVKSDQELKYEPMLAPLDEILIRSALGSRPDGVWYQWTPLWQMTEKEKADVEKIYADTASTLLAANICPDLALTKTIQTRMINSGAWPGFEDALKEFGTEPEPPPEPDPAIPDPSALVPVGDAQPRTLYIRRDVVNVGDFKKWAKQWKLTLDEGLHVTIIHSDTPVDWLKTGEAWEETLTIPAGGARVIEPLGDKGAKVLLFQSRALQWRHEELTRIVEAKWPEFQPHVTLTYGELPDGIEPYQGKIVLGPEIYEETD